jgi:hypothetical protein
MCVGCGEVSPQKAVRSPLVFGVWGLGFGVWGLGFGVWGSEFWGWVWGLGFGGIWLGFWEQNEPGLINCGTGESQPRP